MATRLFLHNATFDTGSFPGSYPDTSGELQADIASPSSTSYTQSGADTVATHRSMNKTKGSSQTSRGVTSQALNNTTQTNYITKFISDPLKNITTIDAEIWATMSAKLQTNSNSNYFGALVALYVWRPDTNSLVGDIKSWSGEGGFAQPTTINTQRLAKGNLTAGTGSQVTGVEDYDVIIYEVYNRKTQSASGPYVDQWYFDGTNEHNSDATQTIVSSVASYIETPQNLTFVTDQIDGTSDYKDILKQRPQQLITNSI